MGYDGVCDKDGCDWAAFRLGDEKFYGPGSDYVIDTTKPVTVVTQFFTDDDTPNGNLKNIRRKYVQNGKVIENTHIMWDGINIEPYDEIGGLKKDGMITKQTCSGLIQTTPLDVIQQTQQTMVVTEDHVLKIPEYPMM